MTLSDDSGLVRRQRGGGRVPRGMWAEVRSELQGGLGTWVGNRMGQPCRLVGVWACIRRSEPRLMCGGKG